jgi:hypothetical protein
MPPSPKETLRLFDWLAQVSKNKTDVDADNSQWHVQLTQFDQGAVAASGTFGYLDRKYTLQVRPISWTTLRLMPLDFVRFIRHTVWATASGTRRIEAITCLWLIREVGDALRVLIRIA